MKTSYLHNRLDLCSKGNEIEFTPKSGLDFNE